VIVQSYGQLQALNPAPPSWQGGHGGGSLDLYGAGRASYGEIYRTQPNIRIGVDFVARNIAMLGLHVFRRVSDTDRVRLADHELAQWITHPNPWTTRYRLIESLLCDIGTYNNAYWLKVRMAPGSGQRLGFLRIPPAEMHAEGGLYPTAYVWTAPNGRKQDFDPSEFVYFGGYDPDSPLSGLSMLYTMRRILAEEAAAGTHREQLWQNASRQEGVWEIPVDSPAARWTPTQNKSWRDQWQEFAGGGSKAGMTAIGPAGGSYKPISFSSKDSEYVAARKLVREYSAASQHIPQPFVGILDHATFSNIREQHKNLYQDTLGPPLEMIQQEFERQILPECDDTTDIYVEFNIDAKMAGTPEERAQSIQLSTGRPWRTVNEARALENMPRIDDPKLDTVAEQQGGPAAAAAPAGDPAVPFKPTPTPARKAADVAPIIQAHQARLKTRLDKLPTPLDRLEAFDGPRVQRELAADLTPVLGDGAETEAARVVALELMRLDHEVFDA
jgi:HK97 family phage portal protein